MSFYTLDALKLVLSISQFRYVSAYGAEQLSAAKSPVGALSLDRLNERSEPDTTSVLSSWWFLRKSFSC
jgi:hypothetical protein